MNVRELEEALAKVEDKSRIVWVSVGNPEFCEDFDIKEVFASALFSNAVYLLVFAEGTYNFSPQGE